MSTLARPKWRVGQVLRPKHLRALEDALSEEARRRARSDGLPAHGLARLDWNGDDPKGGVVSVHGLSAVFPGGAVVDVLDNADIPASLDLAAVGARVVDVFAQIVNPFEDDEEIDPLLAPRGEEIARRRHTLRLSSDEAGRGSLDQLFLGRFVNDPAKGFQLDPGEIPPLLRTSAWRPLTAKLKEVELGLDRFDKKLYGLERDVKSKGQSTAPIHRARLEARRLGVLLDELRGEGARRPIELHPYLVFSALRSFAGEISAFLEAVPNKLPAYDHDHPGAAFSQVFQAIADGIEAAPPSRARVPFVPDGRGYLVATLPDAACLATDLFVLVLKDHEGADVPLQRVKMAAPNRLQRVREYALRGVEPSAAAKPDEKRQYGFAESDTVFQLATARASGDADPTEWDHVVRQRAVALPATPELSRHQFVLCWSAK